MGFVYLLSQYPILVGCNPKTSSYTTGFHRYVIYGHCLGGIFYGCRLRLTKILGRI
jgi:hypothetical protein